MTRIQTLKEDSLFVRGARLFNCMPANLRKARHSLESFKKKLDGFLEKIPDKPMLPHYYQVAASNSIVDQCRAQWALTALWWGYCGGGCWEESFIIGNKQVAHQRGLNRQNRPVGTPSQEISGNLRQEIVGTEGKIKECKRQLKFHNVTVNCI